MAKKSKIAKNDQRRAIVERYAAKRLELKKQLVDPNGTDESREEARLGLQKLPRDACAERLRFVFRLGRHLPFRKLDKLRNANVRKPLLARPL